MISVIVPVYNVEKYLAACIDSILSQSYKDFELLLIDDGSTDSSGAICDDYSSRDSRITVFHKENGGLSDARNYGLKRIKGDYVTFIDSDDVIGNKYLELLLLMINKTGAEVSTIGSVDFLDGNTVPDGTEDAYFTIDRKEALKNLLIKSHFGVSACMKLYQAHLFAGIEFPKGYLYEDLHTTPYVLMRCNKLVFTDSKQYFYRIRNTSISHNKVLSDRDYTVIEGLEKLYQYTVANYPELKDAAVSRYADDLLMVLFQRLVYQKDYVKRIKELKSRCKEIISLGVKNRYIRRNRRVQLRLVMVSPWLFKIAYIASLRARGIRG